MKHKFADGIVWINLYTGIQKFVHTTASTDFCMIVIESVGTIVGVNCITGVQKSRAMIDPTNLYIPEYKKARTIPGLCCNYEQSMKKEISLFES